MCWTFDKPFLEPMLNQIHEALCPPFSRLTYQNIDEQKGRQPDRRQTKTSKHMFAKEKNHNFPLPKYRPTVISITFLKSLFKAPQIQVVDHIFNSQKIPSNTPRSHIYQHGLITFIPACISDNIHNKVWDKITYPFPNFNGCTVEVWEWMNNFTHASLSGSRLGIVQQDDRVTKGCDYCDNRLYRTMADLLL